MGRTEEKNILSSLDPCKSAETPESISKSLLAVSGGFPKPPETLLKPLTRLRNLTGFVTTLCRREDERPLAFARYFHVRRVAWLAQTIGGICRPLWPHLNMDLINWYAWAHDLNRWPFAQNGEKGLFNQADNIQRFFSESGIPARAEEIVDLQRIVEKSWHDLTIEGQIVLLADIVAGFMEDPLWCIVGLNLHPRIVPKDVCLILHLPLDNHEFISRLLQLNKFFYLDRLHEPFMQEFDQIFKEIAAQYLTRLNIVRGMPFGNVEFESERALIKEKFMRGILFPYNNEKISHGSLIKEEMIKPMVLALGREAQSILTSIDEPQAIRIAIDRGIVGETSAGKFFPSLDYVQENEPNLSFRGPLEKN